MKTLLHRLAHALYWNYGNVETWWDGDWCYIGFRCAGCGSLSGAEKLFHR